jgi:predicted Zn-ribbon and HTH transcriptional regulator
MNKEKYKCLRCGYQYEMEADPDGKVKERICPKCKSNSVRKMKSD